MKKVLALAVALLLFVAFLFYQQQITSYFLYIIGKGSKRTPARTVAIIRDNRKNVTIKRSNETIWNTASQKERLALMDSVSTGYDSNALVSFDIGYMINVGERSLIVIESPEKEAANLIEISFDRGSLQASNAVANNATLKIKSDKITTEVKGQSDFTMSVDKNTKKAEIWIKIGEAKVKDNQGNQTIVKANERKQFNTERAIQLEPEPIVMPVPEPTPAEALRPEIDTKAVKPKVAAVRKTPPRLLRRNEIERYVKAQKKKINTCYEKKKTAAEGQSVTIRLTIQNSGIVSRASITNTTLQDPAVERCVIFWVKAIRFPKFDGPAVNETVGFLFQ